jgi:hypothetical protein
MADKKEPLFASISGTWHGHGLTLDKAIENAWDEAKGSGQGPGLYRVLDISFAADNPISEYSIIIGHI